ncbi:MAG: hypothetical protein IPL61_22720 [Myxococcales bacterium]|nr:hypothetical protein [Myxococcales bacterium]
MRTLVVAASLVVGVSIAAAQPLDPYAPADPDPATTRDVEVDTAVAAGLVARARALAADGDDASARGLVVEALARQPGPPVAADATGLLDELDARLAARLPPTVVAPPVAPPSDLGPGPRDDLDLDEPPPRPRASGASTLAVYGAVGGSAVGAALAFRDDGYAMVVGLGLGGAAGSVLGYVAGRRRGDDRLAAHLIGSSMVWGAVAGAMFADVVSGLQDTTVNDVGIGGAIGAIGGAVIGAGLRSRALTAGDAVVINATAALGTLAALELAVLIAPPETEAYTLNGTLGAVGGYALGHVLARKIEVSPTRATKVALLGAAGAAVPWILWAAASDPNTDDDEQTFAALSLVGMAGGVYLGVRATRDAPARATVDDAPLALVRRSSAGGWALGGPAVAPVRAGNARGLAVAVVAGAW